MEEKVVRQRESWDSYFMGMAYKAATRSTCLRRQVGCVLVQKKSIRGTGYNGAPRGIESCLDQGECFPPEGPCIRTVHAEANVILQTNATDWQGATVYCTDRPCWQCANMLANSGVQEIVYDKEYHSYEEEVKYLMQNAGILLRQFSYEGS